MLGSRAWRALMRRNLVYRKRNWIGTILELVLPVFFVYVLVLIKNAVENTDSFETKVIPATFPGDTNLTVTPFSFFDYVTALRAQRRCLTDGTISGINTFNWMVPFVHCDSRKCDDGIEEDATKYCEYRILAVAGINGGDARAAQFKSYLESSYPALTDGSMPFEYDFVQVFGSEAAMDDYVRNPDYGLSLPKIGMGVVMDGTSETKFSYQLRPNSTNFNSPENEGRPATATTPDTSVWQDAFLRDDFASCSVLDGTPEQGPYQFSCTGQYLYNGVLTIQRTIGDFILNVTGAAESGFTVADNGVRFAPFPTRSYEDSGFFAQIGEFAPLLVVLGLLYPVSAMLGYIVKEKALRQKELLKMMSVGESDIGWSWFVTFLSLHVVTATLATIISGQLFENSAGLQLWIFWILTMINVIVFCMCLGALTSKPVRAILIGVLTFFAGVFLTSAVDYDTGNKGTVQLISLHPVAAFSYGISQIGRLEEKGIGLTADSVSFSDNKSGYAFGDTLSMLVLNSILWGIASWYLNRVVKPDFGQALPPWFPFTSKYWSPSRLHAPVSSAAVGEKSSISEIPYEPVGDALKRQADEGKSIEIYDLVKKFGDKSAVDGLNLSMYSGQITALLGHNGAGKTTTINLLTGAMGATEGYAVVAGKDIRTDMDAIRQDIGICLQHDCLFPNLTVREHIQFFSRLKGLYQKVSKEEAEAQISQVIRDVALFEKRNSLSKNLSGGMKRKLSVAMAFCGGSEVVLLDEPTSGMDPFSRRFTWDVIRRYREGRCIILTTHFMDEADILGDRIAIMAEGQLRCAGSPLFLKKTYGVGYQLTIEKNSDDKSEKEDEASASDVVKKAVPEATLLNDVGTEVRFQLPLGAASKFANMFDGLDKQVDKGNIVSYGVSMTTLDEVFLLVARGDHAPDSKEHLASSRNISSTKVGDDADRSARSRMDLDKSGLFSRHVGALFKKRVANFRRDKKAWMCTTFLPSIFVLIGFLVFVFAAPERNLKPVTLDISGFNDAVQNEPMNPLPFNSPGNPYVCQPGNCAYQLPIVVVAETAEVYTFCGTEGNLGADIGRFQVASSNNTCSVTDSADVMGTLNDFEEIFATPTGTGSVLESSFSLFDTSDVYQASQYGAIWFTREQSSIIVDGDQAGTNSTFSDLVEASCKNFMNVELNEESYSLNYTREEDCARFRGVSYVVQYNFTGKHTGPLYQSLADQALVRHATNNPDFVIETTVAPLPITKTEEEFGQAEDAFLAWFLVVLSFPFIAGAFASFVVLERQVKAKHLQTVAGVEPSAYWISTWLWDSINYQIPLWLIVAMMFIFKVNVFTTSERDVFSGVLAILFFYGPASAGFAYCWSFAFNSASLCNVFLIISGFLIGMGGPLTTFILLLIGADPSDPRPKLKTAAKVVTWILRFTPSFCLGKGLFYAINVETFAFLEEDRNLSVWSEPVLLVEVVFLVFQGLLFPLLAILLDIASTKPKVMAVFNQIFGFQWLCTRGEGVDITTVLKEDDDVIAEQDRVLAGDANSDLIVLDRMTKIYANGKIAVNNLSLGIPPGECFGLLGINGAGKTTTMQMLTAEFPPTRGDATLAGFSVANEPAKIRRRIGYCPQFDAHFPNMSGREHVELYASIKGVPKQYVKEAAASKLKEVGLSEYDSDRLCSNYSGGMKRRLSLALATVGQPQIVFLDECSTGVDPVARREIWQLVSDMVADDNDKDGANRTSVILTTHSMEECEALCPRIGIMANGRLRCLGSAQHLKNKFGQGFQVELKVKNAESEDSDYILNARHLAASKLGTSDLEAAGNTPDLFFNNAEAKDALRKITGDDFLSSMVEETHSQGFQVHKDSMSTTGIPLDGLAAFATNELRMRSIDTFVKESFTKHVLRERQDSKARYEVSSEGIRISKIFSIIEEKKSDLKLADYGVSQTSLEQVFNVHAAEAERLKQGRDDR